MLEARHASNPSQRVSAAFRVTGAFSSERFADALAEVVRRHESLRTRFAPSATGFTAFVVSDPAVDWSSFDLRANADADHELDRIIYERRRAPFDVERGPLVRASVLALADDEHVVVLTAHQAIIDCASMGIVVRELSTIYAALVDGRIPELGPVLQYPAYLEWYQRWLDTPIVREQLDYWRRKLADPPPALAFPTDSPHSTRRSGPATDLRFELRAPVARALVDAARRERATLFMGCVAAFAAVLGHHARRHDIVIATPSMYRAHADAHSAVGLFVNLLPLRIDLSGDPTFRTLLGRARAVALEAYANQEAPLEVLVADLERAGAATASFETSFMLLPPRHAAPELPGAVVTELALPTDVSAFDVSVAAALGADGVLHCDLTFASDRFAEVRMIRIAQDLCAFVEVAIAQPTRPIRELVAMTADNTPLPISVAHSPSLDERSRTTEIVAPRNDVEQRIAALWCEVLGIRELSVTDDFFDVGGDSLLALRLLRRMEEALGRQLPLRAIFEATTVEAMARIIAPQNG